jgi:hypothetical protein
MPMRDPALLPLQCMGSMRAACAGMPIRQLAMNRHQAPDQEPLLLASRTPYWLCFFEVTLAAKAAAGVPLIQSHQSTLWPWCAMTALCLVASCKLLHDTVVMSWAAAATGNSACWKLRPLGALQTAQQLAHVAWNRCMPSLAAFTLEDGSLHTVEALPKVTSFCQPCPNPCVWGC